MYSAGLRVSEVVGLNDADLDFEAGVLRVRGKGRRERLAPVGSYAIAARSAGYGCGAPVFPKGTAPFLPTTASPRCPKN